MTVHSGVLAAHDFFRGVDADLLDRLAATAERVEFPAGARLFREGRSADRFWAVQSGQITLDALVSGRGPVTVDTFGRGAILGWSWLFPPRTWRFGAVATLPVTALQFDAAQVRALCVADPALGQELTTRFTAVILQRLQRTRVRLVDALAHDDRHPIHT